MRSVTMRELRNRGGDVIDRVSAGQQLTVTRAGKAVAELRPLRPDALTGGALLERWRHLPSLDPVGLRGDLDSTLDARL